MNFKTLSIAFFSICLSGAALAQDKIIKADGETINARVKSVGRNMIVFLKFDNLNGPEYTIPKNEVSKIKYENGSEVSFAGDDTQGLPPSLAERRQANEALKGKYKSSILAFAPVQFTENGLVGFSLSYERALDNNDIVSFYLPAILEFNSNNNGNNGNPGNPDPMFYLMPGIKIYPTGGYGIAKYAIGPSLVIADGQKTPADTYNPVTGGTITYSPASHFLMGMIINQSVNINPTPHLYIGTELGLGFTYIDQVGGISQGSKALAQFSFKIGYRY